MTMEFEYEIALSFAGEQRDYVQSVAELLKEKECTFFYDEFDETALWGKDLVVHFDLIFQVKAKHCVMFVSKDYSEKVWPSHERRSAFARAIKDRDYLWPVRFDETELPGLPNTVHFVDARKKTPQELVSMILAKLKKSNQAKSIAQNPKIRNPKLRKNINPYDEREEWINYTVSELSKRCSRVADLSFSAFEQSGKKCMRFLFHNKVIYSFNIHRGSLSNDQELGFSHSQGEMSGFSSGGFNGFGSLEWDTKKSEVILKMGMNLFDPFLGNSQNSEVSLSEFVDLLWNKVCDNVEQLK